MKKFLAVLAVLALTVVSSVAFAEVTVSGSVDIRSLAHDNASDALSDTNDSFRVTQERVRLAIDAKNDNVKGRIQIENDWDNWGRVEAPQGNATITDVVSKTTSTYVTSDAGRLKLREAWIDFNLPFGGAHLKGGHQFLQLGNAWFFRSQKYGSDAWLLGFPGKNTFAFVDVKAVEGNTNVEDDVDAYVLLDMYKLDDNNVVGAYLAHLRDPRGVFAGNNVEGSLDNLGLHYSGVVGGMKLQAEFDYQTGSWDTTPSSDVSAMQLVIQGQMPMGPLALNFTLAQGSGDDNGTDNEDNQFTGLLDKDQHYTFVYEFFAPTAAGSYDSVNNKAATTKNSGFANTTALSVGADYKISDKLTVGGNVWMLQATEKVSLMGAAPDTDLGMEIDLRLGWKVNDNLSWNWQYGQLMPGKCYENAAGKADDITAVQGVLSYKF